MKTTVVVFLMMVFALIAGVSTAQNVIEVKRQEFSPRYIEVTAQLEQLRTTPERAITLLTGALPDITDPYERFQIFFWELPTLLCGEGKHRESLDVLKKGQAEGLFYPFILGQNRFPPYVVNLENFDDFQSFLDENKRLRTEAQKTANFEYIVRLPDNYTKDKKYPLMIILYGGFGSHRQQMQDWHSPKLESEYMTAYMQGDQCAGSFLRSYPRDTVDQFVTAYRQIVEKYSVDTTHVLIGAQSAGAHPSCMLMLDEWIPIVGMIFAFPGVPQMEDSKVKGAADRGVRVSILAGENDPRVPGTKEMVASFDKLGLKNRLIIFPGKGHEFPDDFPGEIDRSLEFIGQ